MMKEHLMMTKNKLKGQLAATLKQITSLTVLVKAQLCPYTMDRDVRSVQLDAMVTALTYICVSIALKMTEYSDRKENETEWCSNFFYIHSNGYKMGLYVDTSSIDGEGTHVSVGLCLAKGPHDDKLTWPLRGEFGIALLNQITDIEHYPERVIYYGDNDIDNRVHTELDCNDLDNAWSVYFP